MFISAERFVDSVEVDGMNQVNHAWTSKNPEKEPDPLGAGQAVLRNLKVLFDELERLDKSSG